MARQWRHVHDGNIMQHNSHTGEAKDLVDLVQPDGLQDISDLRQSMHRPIEPMCDVQTGVVSLS